MKAKVHTSNYWVSIELTPEQMEEISALFELAKNTKREIPSIHMSFPIDGSPKAFIQFSKRCFTKQIRSISNSQN